MSRINVVFQYVSDFSLSCSDPLYDLSRRRAITDKFSAKKRKVIFALNLLFATLWFLIIVCAAIRIWIIEFWQVNDKLQ